MAATTPETEVTLGVAARTNSCRWVILAASVVPLACAGWLLRSLALAGPSVGHGRTIVPVELGVGSRLEQTFFNPSSDLSQIAVNVESGGAGSSLLELAIHQVLPNGRLAERASIVTLARARAGAPRPIGVRFPAVPRAWRRWFALAITVREGRVTVVTRPDRRLPRSTLTVDGWPVPGSLVFSAGGIDGRGARYLRAVAADAPAWLKPPAVWIGLLIGFALTSGLVLRRILVSGGDSRRARGWPCAAVPLALFLAATSLWLAVTPPFEAPDELQHYDLVRFVALRGRLPSSPEPGFLTSRWWHPPLYYLLLRPALPAATASRGIPYRENPNSAWRGGPERTLLVHDGTADPAVTGAVSRMRVVSVVLGAMCLTLVFILLRRTLGRSDLAALACATLSLVPGFGYFWSVVNSDTLATLLATGAAVVILAPGARVSLPRAAAAGLLAGLALVTKFSTAYLLPMAIAWLIVAPGMTRGVRSMLLVVFGAAVLATSGWYFARNWWLFGDLLGTTLKLQVDPPVASRSLAEPYFYTTLPLMLHRTFWAMFGWMMVHPETPGVWTTYLAASLLLAAATLCGVAEPMLTRRAGVDRIVWLPALVGLAAEVVAFLLYARHRDSAQARNLYPVLGPVVLFCAVGARAIGRRLEVRLGPGSVRVAFGLGWLVLAIAWLFTWRDAALQWHFGR